MPKISDNSMSRLFREIVLGIAISILIIFVTIYIPIIGLFMAFILPMPILFFRLKLGRNPSLVIMLFVFLMAFGLTNGFSGSNNSLLPELTEGLPELNERFSLSIDMLFYGALLLTGFFLGEFLELRIAIEKSFVFTVISTIGICFAAFFIYSISTGQEMFYIVSNYVSNNLKLTLIIYENMGMSKENIELIKNSIGIIQYVLVRILPGIVTVVLSIVIWINIIFINMILMKKNIILEELQNLNKWKSPEYLVWVAIIMGLLMVIPGKAMKITAINCSMILIIVYFFQGIAIISFILEKKNASILMKIAIYFVIAIQQILIIAIAGLGFFDTWMNFRKIGIDNSLDA